MNPMRSRARVEKRIVYPVGREEVWAAITRPEELSRWFGMEVVSFDLRPRSLKIPSPTLLTSYWCVFPANSQPHRERVTQPRDLCVTNSTQPRITYYKSAN